MTSSKWHQQKSSSGHQVRRGLITAHHQLANTCSTISFKIGWDWENVLGNSEETFSTCLLPKFLWSQFSNSNWKHNSSFLACFPRDSSSINRRGYWRSNARVWNTKQLSLSKQKLSNLFTSLSTIIFISHWEHLSIFVSVQG